MSICVGKIELLTWITSYIDEEICITKKHLYSNLTASELGFFCTVHLALEIIAEKKPKMLIKPLWS